MDGKSSSGCIRCPEGETTSDTASVRCDVCDLNYYSPSGGGPCAVCSDGYGTNGQKGQTLCSPLLTPTPTVSPPTPGPSDPTYVPTRKPVVTKRPSLYPTAKPTVPGECEIGFFSSTGSEPCTPCPDYSSNEVTGSKTCYCNAGYYGKEGEFPCFQCVDGYVSASGDSFCTPCLGFAPCTQQYPYTTPSVPVSKPTSSSSRTTKPTKPVNPTKSRKEKKRYTYQTHSPTRKPTKIV